VIGSGVLNLDHSNDSLPVLITLPQSQHKHFVMATDKSYLNNT